jgi:phosphatidylglycerol:prolipoprotein diacylglycerol transferase
MEFGPQSIQIGQIQIRYYGIIIVLAILVAATVAARLARRDGRDPDHIWGAMFGAVILGIIGARLWFILFPPQSLIASGRDTAWFFQNFFNFTDGAIAIWSGGLHIFGAFLGGLIGVLLYLRANKLPLAPWLDIGAVVLPLGQAIGRWANYVNQELYGSPTTLPWGIRIDSAYRVPPYRSTIDFPVDTLFHPLFLYESIWNLAAFIVLLYIWQRFRKQLRPGTIALLYVAQYSFIRYLLEFIRVEVSVVTVQLGDTLTRINMTQLVCGIAFVISVILLVIFYNSRSRYERPTTVTTSTTPAA